MIDLVWDELWISTARFRPTSLTDLCKLYTAYLKKHIILLHAKTKMIVILSRIESGSH